MAYTFTTETGTGGTSSTTGTVWTKGDGTSTYVMHKQIKRKRKIVDPHAGSVKKTAQEIHKKREFWDGVEWKDHTSYIPRKSITGKIIVGKMHKRTKKLIIEGSISRMANITHTVLGRETSRTQYAKSKELFQEKLKGQA